MKRRGRHGLGGSCGGKGNSGNSDQSDHWVSLMIEADAPSNRSKHRSGYIFFSSHILVVAFHVPPAFAQSASVFAAVAPAKAGPVNASAKATANVEMRIFMGFSPLR
jgi:hypothetical protein